MQPSVCLPRWRARKYGWIERGELPRSHRGPSGQESQGQGVCQRQPARGLGRHDRTRPSTGRCRCSSGTGRCWRECCRSYRSREAARWSCESAKIPRTSNPTILPRGSASSAAAAICAARAGSHTYWHATISRYGFGGTALPSEISPDGYVRDFDNYARVLARVAPHVPLVGPVIAYPALDLDWISRLLAGPHRGLGIVSAHLYRYSACVDRSSPSYPSIARLLSWNATAALAEALRPAVALARRAGLPLRVTELNSVTCGGRRGVSNTFATALWAPDALFELLRAGVDGVNVHVREQAINGAFALRNHGLIARPLLYGLILFARTLGRDASLVGVDVRAPRSLRLSVWAVRVAGGVLHVLLIDKSNGSATVRLELPASGPASVQRLRAPSAGSRSGVTLDGQQLGDDARWQGQATGETIAHGIGGYELSLPRLSAALLSVQLSPAADSGRRRFKHP
jgi:Glycosyl hydrolase family 79 C-terminal beta domain